ncbi:hypothetical protein FB446DRAFT_827738 [Lentinula raphanica]|nr:hypothetical protein FB446DRAFT_827738 [Lentinula raphanica]
MISGLLGGVSRVFGAEVFFLMIVPELYPRYERTTYVPAQRNTYILAPQTTSFGPEKAIPAGWERKVHPEGACYWVYGDGTYYTESDLMDDLTRTRIMDCINDFDDFTRSRSIPLTPPRINTVLSLRIDPDDPDNYTCEYYIANHDTRTVFWLDSVDAKTFPVWWQVKGVTSPTHIEHAIVSFYWYHCHLFPHSYKLTTEAVD